MGTCFQDLWDWIHRSVGVVLPRQAYPSHLVNALCRVTAAASGAHQRRKATSTDTANSPPCARPAALGRFLTLGRRVNDSDSDRERERRDRQRKIGALYRRFPTPIAQSSSTLLNTSRNLISFVSSSSPFPLWALSISENRRASSRNSTMLRGCVIRSR